MRKLFMTIASLLVLCCSCNVEETIVGGSSNFPVLKESNVQFTIKSKTIDTDKEIKYSSFYVCRYDSLTYISISNFKHAVSPGIVFDVLVGDSLVHNFTVNTRPEREIQQVFKSDSDSLTIFLYNYFQ